MLMEAFSGLEHKYCYTIAGHSGESHHIPYDTATTMPRNRKGRLEEVRSM